MFNKFHFMAVFIASWVLLTSQAFAGAEGFWEGTLRYRDDALPLRLEIQDQDNVLSGKLDLPSLVYAGQPVAIEQVEKGYIKIVFPFGIGEISGQVGMNEITGSEGGVEMVLRKTTPPPYSTKVISFGAFGLELEGTVYIPKGKGPFPTVVLIAGSGKANRDQWSYASWADFYVRQGVAAFIYDRRPEASLVEGGAMMGMDDHAKDVAEAIHVLKTLPEIDPYRIGVASHSRGGWIAMALGRQVPDLAFMVFLSPAPVTPAEQTIDSNLTGMDQDGLGAEDLEAARNYLRLYFYVAQTMKGWDLLETLIPTAQETNWGQYLDQPRNLEDLRWWHANMNFSSARHLRDLKMPVLAFWGGDDFITPHARYESLFRQNLEIGGNDDITTYVFPGADHRIELDPGIDEGGKWHWFGMAPGMQDVLADWLKDKMSDSGN